MVLAAEKWTKVSVSPSCNKAPAVIISGAVIAPAKVVTQATLTLSKFVWPSTSKSLRRLKLPAPVNLASSS